jgi:acyl-CoA reductase-like NAD-dependent aldehyde dehydrogenase
MESATTPDAASAVEGNGSAATAAGAPQTFEVHRPIDGSVIREVAITSPAEVEETVARARAAQPEWEAIGFAGRYHWLGRLRDWMFENSDRLADVMQEETGKVRADAEMEVPFICDAINFWGKNAADFLADETPSAPNPMFKVKRLRITYQPYPVVGVISPWNFPLILAYDDAIPALMAGAAVVIKPSEVTPLIAMEIERGWREIGAPDVLHVINGTAETGGALIDEVDFLQFTGSERTGKVVMKRAAETLTPVSLELGGKDPMIVLSDANLERAVNAAAFGGLANTGQICMAIERVYVEEPIYDEFVDKLAARVLELRQGVDDRSYKQDVGAMTFPPQVEIVSDHVEDARSKGARILTGGKRKEGPGNWYEPTVVADADHSMKVMVDETFGPVLGVMKVKDADEAVRMANDTRYGLSASVMSRDTKRAEEIARRLEVGATNVDDVLTNYFLHNVPMGGWKSSGIGFRHGSYGIKRFCRTETIVSPRVPQGKRDPLWFPHKRRERRLVNALFRFINARGLRNRLGLGSRD